MNPAKQPLEKGLITNNYKPVSTWSSYLPKLNLFGNGISTNGRSEKPEEGYKPLGDGPLNSTQPTPSRKS